MKCPGCGAENPEGKEFCGDCGAKLAQEEAQPAAPVPPITAPPVAPPQAPPASAPVAAQPPAYAPPQQQPPAYTPPQQYQPAVSPPPKKKNGALIGIIAGVVLLVLLGCCIGGFAIWKKADDKKKAEEAAKKKAAETIVVKKEKDRGRIEISKEKGFETSMDALTDIANQYYQGADWWYVLVDEQDTSEEYYITPDETTYDKGIVIEQKDGEWFVTDIYTVDMTQVDPPQTDPETETDVTPEEYAAYVVNELLLAIGEGRMEDAYALTAQPLSDLDLSELTGQYTQWEFVSAGEQDDGSVVVIFTMYWSDNTQNNVSAVCIWGDEGMYVSEMAASEQ